MVPILSNIFNFFLGNRLRRLQVNRDFSKEFLPLRISGLKEKLEHELTLNELAFKEKLLPLEINAGISSDYLNANYEAKLEKLSTKLYWQERALKQKIKRRGLDNKVLTDFELNKEEQLLELKNKYYITKILDEDVLEYEEKKKEFESKFNAKNERIIKKYDSKISRIENSSELKINRLETNISKLEKRLSDTLIESKYKLDEGVLLKLDKLSMHFGGLKAVDELSFDVKEGEIFGLIGPNGAGKTTVFNCITRFYKPTSGEVFFRNNKQKVVRLNDIVVHNVIKEGIIRTFQNVEMIWELNVLENLLVAAHTSFRTGFFGQLFNSRRLRREEVVIRAKAMKILTDLDLLQYVYSYPLGLPYGILKKIELARTLMINPKLIILDEPAAGLNDAETEILAKTIKKIRDEYQTTIFLVEHDMGLVMDICDTVCAISFGKKLEIGKPSKIQKSEVVREAYLGGE